MQETNSIEASEGAHPVLWAMAGIMLGFEVMFAAVAHGLLPPWLGRIPIYYDLAFWDPLFRAALAGHGVAPELVWSFLTYAFLHAGWLHLLLNGAVFLGLGNALIRAIGPWRFVATFVITAIAGSLLFALMTQSQGPLVGASGSLFGFLGMITAWQELALRRAGMSRRVIWNRILGLVLLNVILAIGLVGMGGLLAWQAHLGGWIAGWLLAYVFPPRGSAIRIL